MSPTLLPRTDLPLFRSWYEHAGASHNPSLNDLLLLLVDDHQVVAVQLGGLFDDHVLLSDGVVVAKHRTAGIVSVCVCACVCVCVCVCVRVCVQNWQVDEMSTRKTDPYA